MQVSGIDWKGRQAVTTLWTRVGTAMLFLLYLIAAAADPTFWRPVRRRKTNGGDGR